MTLFEEFNEKVTRDAMIYFIFIVNNTVPGSQLPMTKNYGGKVERPGKLAEQEVLNSQLLHGSHTVRI